MSNKKVFIKLQSDTREGGYLGASVNIDAIAAFGPAANGRETVVLLNCGIEKVSYEPIDSFVLRLNMEMDTNVVIID